MKLREAISLYPSLLDDRVSIVRTGDSANIREEIDNLPEEEV